jgi:DNA (cytosine-5)-methyltransferase 1
MMSLFFYINCLSRRIMSAPLFIDLFCGAGGFTEGLKRAGFHHVVGVEIDPLYASTYRANHGDVIEDDLRNVTKERLDAFVQGRKIDLIAASPPCQSFSSCGPRKVGDPKDMLYQEVIRIAPMYQPRLLVIENVLGLLTKRAGSDKIIDTMIRDLAAIGYHAEYRVLSADEFEVPQRRKRVIIVAALDPADISFPVPVQGFDPSVQRVLRAEADVPAKYFWPLHRREYFDRKPKYVKYLDVTQPCCTLRACYAKNRGADAAIQYAPDRVRMMTEQECAAIQSFPDTYVFKGSMTKQYKQIGNAIPVNLAKHVGCAILGSQST